MAAIPMSAVMLTACFRPRPVSAMFLTSVFNDAENGPLRILSLSKWCLSVMKLYVWLRALQNVFLIQPPRRGARFVEKLHYTIQTTPIILNGRHYLIVIHDICIVMQGIESVRSRHD